MKPVHTSDHPAILAQGGGVFQSLPRQALENPDVTRGTADLAKDLAALCGSAQRFSRASFGMGNN
jgi:hypothetical protein